MEATHFIFDGWFFLKSHAVTEEKRAPPSSSSLSAGVVLILVIFLFLGVVPLHRGVTVALIEIISTPRPNIHVYTTFVPSEKSLLLDE